MRESNCFVIMPFSATKHGTAPNEITIEAKEWNHIYEHWIKKAVESHRPDQGKTKCRRSAASPGNFIKGIVADLSSAGLVIADLTGEKPNVYYELGIRHALRVGTIIITQDLGALPSDLKGYFAFEYTYKSSTHEYEEAYARFEKRLHEMMDDMCMMEDLSDNPVSDFLGIKHALMEKTLAAEQSELKLIMEGLRASAQDNFEVTMMFEKMLQGRADEIGEANRFPMLDTFSMDVYYTRLVSYPWRCLGPGTLELFGTIVMHLRKLFRSLDRSLAVLDYGPEHPEVLIQHMQTLFDDVRIQKSVMDTQWDGVVKSIDTIKVVLNQKRE